MGTPRQFDGVSSDFEPFGFMCCGLVGKFDEFGFFEIMGSIKMRPFIGFSGWKYVFFF
ncbi:hypothetical protein QJS04_geneDACA011788 [Acorus gramineus]|uniref:NADH dehydrogenase subunit 1 n=1 Tax=Acorus gramineus TaxID=55184 RepID=A0AAV9BJM8_ACOGR|nr:hypothetical protein QJS04_geneDACA011788 [Acorus gramineus]